MDKNLSGEQSEKVKAQISNMSNIRSRKGTNKPGATSIAPLLVSSGIIPMGMGMMMRDPKPKATVVTTENIELTARTKDGATVANGGDGGSRRNSIVEEKEAIQVTKIEITPPEDPNDTSDKDGGSVEFEIGL